MSPPFTKHETTFQTSRDGQVHRAICTCGWQMEGTDLATIQAMAASHDLPEPPSDEIIDAIERSSKQ